MYENNTEGIWPCEVGSRESLSHKNGEWFLICAAHFLNVQHTLE